MKNISVRLIYFLGTNNIKIKSDEIEYIKELLDDNNIEFKDEMSLVYYQNSLSEDNYILVSNKNEKEILKLFKDNGISVIG